MDTVLQILGSASFISLVLMTLARFLPNDKLDGWGQKLGRILTRFGNLRLGSGYEQLEDFLVNSFGAFFSGVRKGLDSDDE